MYRSHKSNTLVHDLIGQTVILSGWIDRIRDHGGLGFIDLRDSEGITQLMVKDPHHLIALSLESVIQVKGTLEKRPPGMIKKDTPNGDLECVVQELTLLSQAEPMPIPMHAFSQATDALRLKYRYLDLRRQEARAALRLRHEIVQTLRNFLNEEHFLEVETPILYKSTPEGARDFLVPSRIERGHFYALPQSPQTMKQLLMMGGVERYYQVARCFRDEDLRSDRQLEFSQLDLEVSFLEIPEFLNLIERMICTLWRNIHGQTLKTPFQKLSYQDAMNRYGTDKPDLRFDLPIQDITSLLKPSEFKVFQQAEKIGCLVLKGQAEAFSRKRVEHLQSLIQPQGAKGLLSIKIQKKGQWVSPAAKFLTLEIIQQVEETMLLEEGDQLLVVADTRAITTLALGTLRLQLGHEMNLLDTSKDAFLWVTDFPLLEFDPSLNRYFAMHHPFTRVHSEDRANFLKGDQLSQLRAEAYDLVLNGAEIGGGSARIFKAEEQRAMFRSLGLSEEESKAQFGFFLEALQYGTPPHLGLALGLDRLVAIMGGFSNIKEVIAFPKSQKGTCLMSECPSAVQAEQLAELGIQARP
jgi:aspartyl-tRNA synthetase